MASSRSGRGKRVRTADMDDISGDQVRRSDVLVGRLSAKERRVGENILDTVRKAKGVVSAMDLAITLGVDESLILEFWKDDE